MSDSGADRKVRKQRKKGGGGIESLGFHDMQISRVRNGYEAMKLMGKRN